MWLNWLAWRWDSAHANLAWSVISYARLKSSEITAPCRKLPLKELDSTYGQTIQRSTGLARSGHDHLCTAVRKMRTSMGRLDRMAPESMSRMSQQYRTRRSPFRSRENCQRSNRTLQFIKERGGKGICTGSCLFWSEDEWDQHRWGGRTV
jgi:hypothetical protein